jgi:hypothetical protein
MFKNWKTTVLGWIAAIVGVTTVGWFRPDGSINWVAVVLGLLVGLLGTFAKDHDVTGGTVPLTKEAEARTTGAAAQPSTKK